MTHAALPRPRRALALWLIAAGLLLGIGLLTLAVRTELQGVPVAALGADGVTATPALLERGAQLAAAGNCMACHTARGGEPWAGGRPVNTPFGPIYASNLTPDPETGLGRWSAGDFRRALLHGQSRDGRLLYPAFPYNHTTRMTVEDVDALYAHLRTLPPVVQPAREHGLRFPFNTQAALALWRILYFSPGTYQPDAARSAEWNRGAYLVTGVAHCAACHAERDVFGGGSVDRFGGGLMPDGRWWAPSLHDPAEGGTQAWGVDATVALLAGGRNAHASGQASTLGPMAEVVLHGTQHLPESDLRAMAVYLVELPVQPVKQPGFEPAPDAVLTRGGRLYEQHCAQCHGDAGEGAAGAYPPLAGHRAVTQSSPVNAVQAILSGGFAPATRAHPRPYGMPPYRSTLSDDDVAAVTSFIRQSWGNRAGEVTALDVARLR